MAKSSPNKGCPVPTPAHNFQATIPLAITVTLPILPLEQDVMYMLTYQGEDQNRKEL